MLVQELIRKKRDGGIFSQEEIEYLVSNYTKGEIPDYQFSALLMAIYFRGMTSEELLYLTKSYIESGVRLDLSDIKAPKIDKHSTGGVGDKVSLILAPLVASCGVAVPMISGRGLGHTGGTLDKLESIPGFRTMLTIEELKNQLRKIGVAICGQTKELVVADGKIYALRDVTATVDSIPLISASIMSKKLAEGIDRLVLDVKTGNGAFMQEIEKAVELAQTMCKIGNLYGKPAVALVTDMNEPLGEMVGNALEVLESVQILQGQKRNSPVCEIVLTLGAFMLILAGFTDNLWDGRKQLETNLLKGKALEKFQELVAHQGGDTGVCDKPESIVKAKYRFEVPSQAGGYVAQIDTRAIGVAAIALGAGRASLEDKIDHSAGLIVRKKVGDKVEIGEPLVEILANDETRARAIISSIQKAYKISEEKCAPRPLIYYLVDHQNVTPWEDFLKNPIYKVGENKQRTGLTTHP